MLMGSPQNAFKITFTKLIVELSFIVLASSMRVEALGLNPNITKNNNAIQNAIQSSRTEEAGLDQLLTNEIRTLSSIDQNLTLDLIDLLLAQNLQEPQRTESAQMNRTSVIKVALRFKNSK